MLSLAAHVLVCSRRLAVLVVTHNALLMAFAEYATQTHFLEELDVPVNERGRRSLCACLLDASACLAAGLVRFAG